MVSVKMAGVPTTVVLLHGFAGTRRAWDPVVERLDRERYTPLAPDLRGHGDARDARPVSFEACVADVLAVAPARFVLCGYSMGGRIAQHVALAAPERVERLVLVGSGGLGREVNPALRAATLPGAEWVLPALASGWVRGRVETVGRTLAWTGWRASNDMRAAWEGFARLSDADGRRAFLATTRAVIDAGGQSVTAQDYLPDLVDIPVLVVWGTNDMVIPAEHAARAKEAIPGCRVELFEGAGHFPHLDDPDRFTLLVRDFIATTGPGHDVAESAS
jgi:pimeloyl-ACP methyl ester carboxylesterase